MDFISSALMSKSKKQIFRGFRFQIYAHLHKRYINILYRSSEICKNMYKWKKVVLQSGISKMWQIWNRFRAFLPA